MRRVTGFHLHAVKELRGGDVYRAMEIHSVGKYPLFPTVAVHTHALALHHGWPVDMKHPSATRRLNTNTIIMDALDASESAPTPRVQIGGKAHAAEKKAPDVGTASSARSFLMC